MSITRYEEVDSQRMNARWSAIGTGCGPYVGIAELRERGWSRAMITELLGPPDETECNPGGRNAPRVKLFDWIRVVGTEGTDLFHQRLAQAEVRRAAQLRSPGRELPR
uniref:hypothetical protein n=1 Tax=Amycolatopsis sp. CA-096443 TaxID=3239919 RepID=UPI003F4925DD